MEWLFWAKWFLVICAAELFIQIVKDALNFIKRKNSLNKEKCCSDKTSNGNDVKHAADGTGNDGNSR